MNARGFRHGVRQVSKRPMLSIVVITMLALGIGSTTAIFSLFHQVLLQPLPVPEPQRLVNVIQSQPPRFSYDIYRGLAIQARQSELLNIAAYDSFDANLVYGDQAFGGLGMLVSGSYFQTLGIGAALGRAIGSVDEQRIGESAVAVLSHEYWASVFDSDSGAIGQSLTINGEPFTIVGVAEEGFYGTAFELNPTVFVPMTMAASVDNPESFEGQFPWLTLFGRLAPDVDVDQASTAVDLFYERVTADGDLRGSDRPEAAQPPSITLEPGARGQTGRTPVGAAQPLHLLLGVTVMVLAIVCINIANLLLARGASRMGELAVRTAIGASPHQLMTQLLAEASCLAIIGGLASIPVAMTTLRLIALVIPPEIAEMLATDLNLEALLFAALATLATLLLFGLYPAVRVTRTSGGLHPKGQVAQLSSARGVVRVRGLLATAQIAFSAVLLILAGLFARSLMNIDRVDLGLDPDSVVSFRISPGLSGYSQERMDALYDQIDTTFGAEPGVAAVGAAVLPLVTGAGIVQSVQGLEPAAGRPTAWMNMVHPGFFRTLELPLLAGRDFTDADTADSQHVAVVNEAFVRHFGLGDNIIGTRFGNDDQIEIVGIVRNAAYNSVKRDIPPQYYVPRRQASFGIPSSLTFYVRTEIDVDTFIRRIPPLMAEIAPNLPVTNVATMESQVADIVYLDRLVTMLSVSLAALATLLAAIGLYGMLAYNVTERTREFGLRLALGATPMRVRSMVFRQVGLMTLIGLPIGLVIAVILGRSVESLLFGMSGHEPSVIIVAVLVLASVLSLAALIPAGRAARIAPLEALRYE